MIRSRKHVGALRTRAEKELVQEAASLGRKPGRLPAPRGVLHGCQRGLWWKFGTSVAGLKSPQQAKVLASSRKGLGESCLERGGLGKPPPPHRDGSVSGAGVAAHCGAGGCSRTSRAPCAPCSSDSILQMLCLWLSYCSQCGAGGSCRTRCRATRACGVISEQAGSLSALLGAGWWGFHAS